MNEELVGREVRLVGPFEPDMPEHSVEATVKAAHDDGTVDLDMAPFALTFKERVPFVADGEDAPACSFCEPLNASSRWRLVA